MSFNFDTRIQTPVNLETNQFKYITVGCFLQHESNHLSTVYEPMKTWSVGRVTQEFNRLPTTGYGPIQIKVAQDFFARVIFQLPLYNLSSKTSIR